MSKLVARGQPSTRSTTRRNEVEDGAVWTLLCRRSVDCARHRCRRPHAARHRTCGGAAHAGCPAGSPGRCRRGPIARDGPDRSVTDGTVVHRLSARELSDGRLRRKAPVSAGPRTCTAISVMRRGLTMNGGEVKLPPEASFGTTRLPAPAVPAGTAELRRSAWRRLAARLHVAKWSEEQPPFASASCGSE